MIEKILGTGVSVVALVCALASPLAGQGRPPFRGVEHGKAYNRPVTVELEPGATGRGRLRLNGEPVAPGARIDKDGVYVLEALPEEAGKAPSAVLFTVDTTPPRITLRRPAGAPKGALPQADVEDANPDPSALQWFLDDRPLDRSKPIPKGKHVLKATTRDLAGNTASVTESLLIGDCVPETYRHHVRPTRTLTAVHYFPWYRGCSSECPANCQWCHCIWGPKPGKPRPALGFYDSSNQAVVNAHIQQMVDHGIDVVSVEWNNSPFEKINYETRILPAVSTRNIQVVLLYDLAIRMTALCGTATPTMPSCVDKNTGTINFNDQRVRQALVQDFTLFATNANYFKHPKYLKLKNRPVIYVYITRAMVGDSALIQDVYNQIQAAARLQGFAGLYLVADHLFWGTNDYNLLQRTQAMAATSFGPLNPHQGVPEDANARPVRIWADKMAGLYWNALGPLANIGMVDLMPGVFVQYDDRGLDVAPCKSRDDILSYNLKDGSDWAYMLQTAGVNRTYVAEQVRVSRTCNETTTTNTDYTSIVWIYSFNEWYEGSGLERLDPRVPPYPYGFGLEPLQILKTKLP